MMLFTECERLPITCGGWGAKRSKRLKQRGPRLHLGRKRNHYGEGGGEACPLGDESLNDN